MNFQPTFCIDISDTVEIKMEAVAAYESQFSHVPALPEMVKTLTGNLGAESGRHMPSRSLLMKRWGLGGLDQLV